MCMHAESPLASGEERKGGPSASLACSSESFPTVQSFLPASYSGGGPAPTPVSGAPPLPPYLEPRGRPTGAGFGALPYNNSRRFATIMSLQAESIRFATRKVGQGPLPYNSRE